MKPGATDSAIANHPRRQQALDGMLAGRSDREIAAELGCAPSTVWRWRQDPSFAAELHAAQAQRIEAMTDRVTALAVRALGVVEELMSDEGAAPALRLRAAEVALDRAGWSGGAAERRIRASVTGHMNDFLKAVAERVPKETLDAVLAALAQPISDDPKRPAPTLTIRFPEEEDDAA